MNNPILVVNGIQGVEDILIDNETLQGLHGVELVVMPGSHFIKPHFGSNTMLPNEVSQMNNLFESQEHHNGEVYLFPMNNFQTLLILLPSFHDRI